MHKRSKQSEREHELYAYCFRPVAVNEIFYSPVQVIHLVVHAMFGTALLVFICQGIYELNVRDFGRDSSLMVIFLFMVAALMLYHFLAIYQLAFNRKMRLHFAFILTIAYVLSFFGGIAALGIFYATFNSLYVGTFRMDLLIICTITTVGVSGYLLISIATTKLQNKMYALRKDRKEEFEILYPDPKQDIASQEET